MYVLSFHHGVAITGGYLENRTDRLGPINIFFTEEKSRATKLATKLKIDVEVHPQVDNIRFSNVWT